MSIMSIFQIAGSGMAAQTVRMNATASNLSNAETVSSSPESAYKARYPVFSAVQQQMDRDFSSAANVAVRVDGIVENKTPGMKLYQPGNSLADKDGYVYTSNVNTIEEMTNMISASRTYQMNAQVMDTEKENMMRTLQIGQ